MSYTNGFTAIQLVEPIYDANYFVADQRMHF